MVTDLHGEIQAFLRTGVEAEQSDFRLFDEIFGLTGVDVRFLAAYEWYTHGPTAREIIGRLEPLVAYLREGGVAESWKNQGAKLANELIRVQRQDRITRILVEGTRRDLRIAVFYTGIAKTTTATIQNRHWRFNDLKQETKLVPDTAQAAALATATLFRDINEVIDQWVVAHEVAPPDPPARPGRSVQPVRRTYLDPVLIARWDTTFFEVCRWG